MDPITIPSVATSNGTTLYFKFSQAVKRRMREMKINFEKPVEERTVEENEDILAGTIRAMAYVKEGESYRHAGLSLDEVEELLTPRTIPIFQEAVTQAFLAELPTTSTPAVGQAAS